MKTIKLLCIILYLFSIYNSFGEAQDNLNFNYNIKKGSRLDVLNDNGSINIDTWDKDYINIVANKLSWSWNAEKELEQVVIDIQKSDNGSTTIRSNYNRINPEKVFVYLGIKIPKDIFLDKIRINNGDVTLNRSKGDISVFCVNGNITANIISGNISIETSNGSVVIKNITGNCDVETSNGKIELSDSSGDAMLKNSSGKIEVYNTIGSIKITNSQGDIRVNKNTGNINLATSLGNIDVSNITGFVNAVSNNGRIKIKNARGIINAETVNGDILGEIYSIFNHETIVKTDNGRIQLYLSPGINADIEINSLAGSIFIDNDLNINLTKDTMNLKEGIIGRGGNKLTIITKNGGIMLVKL